jgi:hypothetical protein
MKKKVWIMCDYSQAEIRVAAWKGPIPAMKTWFQRGEDIHINVARLIGKVVHEAKVDMPFIKGSREMLWRRKPPEELNADDKTDNENERDLSKRTVHANTNGMWKNRFALITGLPVPIAGIVQDTYHGLFPEIRGNYHKGIQNEVLSNGGTLVNPWGWPRTFYKINPFTGTYDEDELRVMYAWYPQSTIGMLTVKAWTEMCSIFEGIYTPRLWKPSEIVRLGLDCRLQVHDLVGVSCEDDPVAIRETATQMKKCGEIPMVINNEELIVPMDFKVGPSWGEMKKYVLQ